MLALRSSHRAVRLHTFEPEDRAYTSTPTKIGGHCLDHVVGVTLTWRRSLNERESASSRRSAGETISSRSSRSSSTAEAQCGEHLISRAGEGSAPAWITTLGPSGRFGGLRGTVLQPPKAPPPRAATAVFLPRLYPTPTELPPDSLAARNPPADAASQFLLRGHGPEWPADDYYCPDGDIDEEEEVEVVAPHHGGTSSTTEAVRTISATSAKAEGGGGGRAAPSRNTAAQHSGALMAILLSKLAANSGYGGTTGNAVPDAPSVEEQTTAAAVLSCAGESRPGALHRSADSTTGGLDGTRVGSTAPVRSGDGGWAWKARVDQAPRYSKLRRYDFVRELGSGSHGTVWLVRKRSATATDRSTSVAGSGKLDANNTRVGGGGGSGGHARSKGSSVRDDCGGCKSSSNSSRSLRVLKESPFLSEAVNEARLLLLAGGGDGGSAAGDPAVAGALGARRRDGAATESTCERGGSKVGGDFGRAGAGAALPEGRRGGDGGRGYQRGEVVQLHDFFVETHGHRSLAFLELEYCEGGDLHDLILGGRPTRPTPAAPASPAVRTPASSEPHEGVASLPPVREGADLVSGGGVDRSLMEGEGSVAAAETAWKIGLAAAQIGRVALGLCEGLQRLHRRGVLHRDLKPANVLLTKSGAVRVADLGVSTRLDPSRPLTENAAGTVPFMAPEVRKFLLGSKISYSSKADVWAVGALVYAMAVGDPAPAELATQTRAQLVSVVGHQTGSEALALVAHRALDPDPFRRPTVDQMAKILKGGCEREGWLARSAEKRLLSAAPPNARL